MKTKQTKPNPRKILGYLMAFAMVFFTTNANAQCFNTSSYGSATANVSGTATISTCNYLSEVSTISGVAAASSYTCDIQIGGATVGYVTITEGSASGTVVSHGAAPHTWTSNAAGTYYAHWTVDGSCATASGCHTTTITGNAVVVNGCTDPIATNYNALANVDDGSCLYVMGCTDPAANNYDPLATMNDGSCTYAACTAGTPYSEDFSAGVIPAGVCSPSGWSISATSGDGWKFTGNPGYNAGSNGSASGTYAWIDFSGTDIGTVMQVEDIDITALASPTLTFDLFMDPGTYSAPANPVYIEAYDGTAWNVISTHDQNTSGWAIQIVDLTGADVSGVVTLRFRAESSGASNDYNNDVLVDNLSVDESAGVYGCTDTTACNFNVLATADDGTCDFSCIGCTDTLAYNYSAVASIDDGSCLYGCPALPTAITLPYNGVGLTNCGSNNVNNSSSYDNGEDATYEWTATSNNVVDVSLTNLSVASYPYAGLFVYDGCPSTGGTLVTSSTSGNGPYACTFTQVSGTSYFVVVDSWPSPTCYTSYDLSIVESISGCTDSTACNYNALASIDDGSCDYSCLGTPGCMDTTACNYDALATVDDGSCTFAVAPFNCAGSCANGGTFYDIIVKEISVSWGSMYTLVGYGGSWSLTDANTGAVVYGGATDNFAACLGDGCYEISGISGSGSSYAFAYSLDGGVTYITPGVGGATGTDQFSVGAGVCLVLGCTDSLAINYNAAATTDDGSCTYGTPGCTDVLACNYDALATVDDGSCTYAVAGFDCSGNCLNGGTAVTVTMYNQYSSYSWAQGGGEAYLVVSNGTSSDTLNKSVTGASLSHALCLVDDCWDITAYDGGSSYLSEYSWDVTDASGTILAAGIVNTGATSAQFAVGSGSCFVAVLGCTDTLATNYDPAANTDDGSCIYPISGCTDSTATNYNALATVDDGSCTYPPVSSLCCNSSAYGSATANPIGAATISTCNYLSEYSTISGISAGESYTVDIALAGVNTGWVSIYEGATCGTLVAEGPSPLTFTSTVTGTHYAHWHVDATCATASGCHVTTITGNNGILGCTDSLALNYNAAANVDDGSCNYPACLAVAPYTEDFSAGTLPAGVCPGGWSISSTTGGPWVFTGNPGYEAANNGRAPGTYAWIDFSGSDFGVAMQVEDIDISGLSSPSMTFDYFSDIGTYALPYPNTMYVEAYDGSAWNVIGTFDQFTSGWETKLVDLAGADVAGTVTLRFRGESGSGGMTSTSDFYNDLLVDDISVDEMPPAGCTDTTAFNYDPTATIDDGSCIPVIFGCMDPLAGNFNASANTADTCIYAVIGCMDSLACDYDPLATVSATCTYAVPGFTCAGNCASGVGANSESFEDAPAMGLYTQGPWADWTYDAATSTFTSTNGWRADNLGTGSSGTGPLNGAPSADGDYYLYCETSGQYNKIANLVSSCVDLANFSSPNFVASVSMYGATMGTLNIDVSTDGGANWNNEWTLSGNQGQPWFDAIVDLSSYSGQIVQVRMNYTSSTSFTGDCAIDNLRFMEAPASGCMDPLACNYDPAATIDDGSCYTLTASASAVDVTCNGSTDGSVSVTANASPLIYMWDNGGTTASISGLAPGTYSVTVEDNTGCVATASATVGEPSVIALSAVVGNESPAGSSNGSIDLTASGGVPCITVQTLSSHNPGLSQNGSNGCHFNITNTSTSPLTITDIAQGSYTYSGANTITVYSMPAPYDHTTSAGTWAQVGQAAVTIPAGGSFAAPVYSSPVVLSSPVTIPAGATYGFYVGGTSTVSYATATAAGAVGSSVASDAYISVSSGHGGTFGAGSFSPRSPLVQVGYGDPTASAYTFAWGNGATTEDLSGLAAGTYSVTATDCNGCTSSASYTVIVQSTPGCMDTLACNYNALATVDDGSCILPDGCTDSTALNYNASALCDDGSCIAAVYGCTDPLALNYDANANTDDGSCSYNCANTSAYPSAAVAADPYGAVTVSTCNYLSEYSTISGVGAGESYTAAISGVNANPGYIVVYEGSSAGNFVAQGSAPLTWTSTVAGTYYIHWLVDSTCATASGCHTTTLTGNAVVSVPGCTDTTALNYDPSATVDDGSCIFCVYGCTDTTAFNYSASATCDDGSCIAVVYGCTDATACNYYAGANVDDGSCEWTSCASTCTGPDITGLSVSSLIHDRVTLNFDNMNSYDASGAQVCRVDQIRIKYREVGTSSWSQKNMASPTGTDPVTGICNSTQNTSKLVLNLTASTTYEWEVKVWYCDGQNTGFVAGPNFTTLAACPNVANVAVSTPSTTKATFTWDASNGSYSFVRLKARPEVTLDPINSWFNIGGMGVAYGTNTKDKNNLTPGESYRGQARTWCDPNGGPYRATTWSPLVFWTQPTTIRLEGSDAIANLDVYPNPSRDVFNVAFTSEEVQDLDVRVVNVVGEVIYTENLDQFVGEYTKAIDLATYTKGVYFLEITTDNGVVNKKLILQ